MTLNRRHFLLAASAVAVAGPRALAANELVRVGVIGLGNQGKYNWGELAKAKGCQVVAICDVDERMTADARKQFPKAAFFTDYRKMIEAKGLDAVLCATPDHSHFPATHLAMSNGLHAYCEKPLTHTVEEARKLSVLAAEKKLVTQMGTQIHAGNNYRRVVELVKGGAIGDVAEVHVWVGGAWNGNGKRPEPKPVPKELDWDLWQGPTEERPYSPEYVPFNWRKYWAYGGGRMADMACHHMDLPFWALDLKHPTTISSTGSPVTPETGADWIVSVYEYAARGKMPAVKLTWHDGPKRPPQFAEGKLPKWGDGTLFVGSKGMLLADYGRYVLLPESEAKPDMSIKNSVGHHQEWIDAIRNGGPTTCNFSYSGALTEAVLLGVASYRLGKPIDWDATNLKAKGLPEADALIRKTYRKGWAV